MWKPTLGIKLSSAAEATTIHALAAPPAGTHRGVPQALNHFPSVKPIASKNGLFRSLQVYYARCGVDVYDNVPTTFLLQNITKPEGAAEWARFVAYFRALAEGRPGAVGERLPPKHCAANFWIVKPGYLNQGKGISVHTELGAIKEVLVAVERDGLVVDGQAVASGAEWVVQVRQSEYGGGGGSCR